MEEAEEEFLTAAQVAKILGVTSASISKWCHEGLFPGAYRVNPSRRKSAWRIPRKAVDQFIKKRTEQRGYFYVPVQPDQIQKRETKTEVPPGDDTDEEQATDKLVQLGFV